MVTKPAMDAAIAAAVDAATKRATDATVARMREIAEAETLVQPLVGKMTMAFDSAEDVYKEALKIMGVKTKNVHPSAYRTILEHMPKPRNGSERIAADSLASIDDPEAFSKLFPDAARIRHA